MTRHRRRDFCEIAIAGNDDVAFDHMSVRNSSKRGIANDNSSERRLVEGADVEAVLAVRGVHPLDDDVAHSRDERAGFGHVAEIDLDRRKQQVPDLDVAGEYVLDGASAGAVRLDAQTALNGRTVEPVFLGEDISGAAADLTSGSDAAVAAVHPPAA